MKGIDLLVLAVIAGVLGLAVFFVCRAKKKGVKCIGCPYGATCNKKGCGGCSHQIE